MNLTRDLEKARRGQVLAAWAVLLGLVVNAIMTVGFHASPAAGLGYVGFPLTALFATTARYHRLKNQQDQPTP